MNPSGSSVGPSRAAGAYTRPRHPKWKTVLCKNHGVYGYCPWPQERCSFAHGVEDLRADVRHRWMAPSTGAAEPPAAPAVCWWLVAVGSCPCPPGLCQFGTHPPGLHAVASPTDIPPKLWATFVQTVATQPRRCSDGERRSRLPCFRAVAPESV
jgi:hypothetical protein